MKLLKTIFISISLFLICSIGVMAQSAPQYYIGSDGQPKQITVPSSQFVQITGETQKNGDGQETEPQILDFSPSGNWYWVAGSTTTADGAGTTVTTIKNVSLSTTTTGSLNIVVDSSAADAFIENTNPWNLNSQQEINIYRAASGMTDTYTIADGYLRVYNNPTSVPESPATGQSAITLSGGTLNVNSGILNATAQAASGITLSSGNAKVTPYAALLSIYNVYATTNTASETNAGLTINGGTLTNQGYLRSAQNYVLNNVGASDYAAIQVSDSLTSGSGLIVNGGTVQTSTQYTPSSNLTSGVWIQTFGTTGSSNSYSCTTFNVDAFGGTSAQPVTLNLGKYDSLQLINTNNTFEVAQNANLVIPDNYNLTFGSSGTTATMPSLIVGQGATLTLDNANITMNQNSILTNNGTIDVIEDVNPS